VDDTWREVFATLVREGDLVGCRVLDVGCGTGRLAAALAASSKVWAVDPSPEMLEVARRRAPSVRFKQGPAEALPFKDGWFERATMWLVAHLVDRSAAFAEIRRVLAAGGRIAIATFDPSYFGVFWLREYFPSMEALDRARFPASDDLAEELPAAGFNPPRFTRLSRRGTLSRQDALRKIRGRHIATFDLISDEEYARGLVRAERELPERVEYPEEWLIAVAEASVRPAL
jgi:ubiquinone/menaquinone biosynthesis C-methylase UbiE